MTHPAKPVAYNANRYARYVVCRFRRRHVRRLEKRGIYCQPSVSIEHQHLAAAVCTTRRRVRRPPLPTWAATAPSSMLMGARRRGCN